MNIASTKMAPSDPTCAKAADVTVVGGAGHVGVPLVLAFAEAGGDATRFVGGGRVRDGAQTGREGYGQAYADREGAALGRIQGIQCERVDSASDRDARRATDERSIVGNTIGDHGV